MERRSASRWGNTYGPEGGGNILALPGESLRPRWGKHFGPTWGKQYGPGGGIYVALDIPARIPHLLPKIVGNLGAIHRQCPARVGRRIRDGGIHPIFHTNERKKQDDKPTISSIMQSTPDPHI